MIAHVSGLKISRPWLGYGQVLFLELGRLRTEKVIIPGRGPHLSKRGQATILIHSLWKAESAQGFLFGIDSSEKVLKAALKGLHGRRVTGLALQTRGLELEVELDEKIWLRSVRAHGPPDWDVFLHDGRLFPRESRWHGIDTTLGVGVSDEGQLQRWVCHDHIALRPDGSRA